MSTKSTPFRGAFHCAVVQFRNLPRLLHKSRTLAHKVVEFRKGIDVLMPSHTIIHQLTPWHSHAIIAEIQTKRGGGRIKGRHMAHDTFFSVRAVDAEKHTGSRMHAQPYLEISKLKKRMTRNHLEFSQMLQRGFAFSIYCMY